MGILRGLFIIIAGVFFFICGCIGRHDREGHAKVVEFGEMHNDRVKQFVHLPESENHYHFITYFDGYGGSPIWNSFAKMHGRYKIKMKFDIEINRRARTFEPKSPVTVYISEVTGVRLPSSGTGYGSCDYGEGFTLSSDDWDTVMKNNGDFSSVGVILKKDAPIENFDRVGP